MGRNPISFVRTNPNIFKIQLRRGLSEMDWNLEFVVIRNAREVRRWSSKLGILPMTISASRLSAMSLALSDSLPRLQHD